MVTGSTISMVVISVEQDGDPGIANLSLLIHTHVSLTRAHSLSFPQDVCHSGLVSHESR